MKIILKPQCGFMDMSQSWDCYRFRSVSWSAFIPVSRYWHGAVSNPWTVSVNWPWGCTWSKFDDSNGN